MADSTRKKSPLPGPDVLHKLPVSFDYPGNPRTRVLLDVFQRKHLDEVRAIWQESGAVGEGGVGATDDFCHVEEEALRGNPLYRGTVMVDLTNSKVMGAIFTTPAYPMRSEAPVLAAALVWVDKAYRRSGIGIYITSLIPMSAAMSQYCGVLGKAVVVAKSLKAGVKNRGNFLGTFNWCSELQGDGWYPDNIYFHFHTAPDEIKAKAFTINKLGIQRELMARLPMFTRPPPAITLPTLHHDKLGALRVSFANSTELWTIQEILRDLATSGEGFGLDEFTADGVYNEKFIRNCSYMVVRKESDDKMAAVILGGYSGFPRTLNNEQVAGVIVVLKPFRRQGLGDCLYGWCETQAKVLGYKQVHTDVLASNAAGLALMRKRGFYITGTIPMSCIVGGRYTNSFVHWKALTHPNLFSNI